MQTPKKSAAAAVFLRSLELGWSVTAAAQQADVHRLTIYKWRARDRKFAEAWDHAMEVATDALEDELRRRAMEGGTKTTKAAEGVVTVTQASDRLLIALLAARRPERYRPLRRTPEAAREKDADDSARKRLHRKLDRLARALAADAGDAADD